ETTRYFFSGGYISRDDLPNNEFHTRFYDDGRIRFSQIPENREQTRVILRGGVDWQPTDVDTISFSSIFDREHHNDFANIPFLDQDGARTRLWFWTEDEVEFHGEFFYFDAAGIAPKPTSSVPIW
ncbi:MAG: hypothetical protein ACKVG0_12595, partial [Alphaproteobacteria bacterium]